MTSGRFAASGLHTCDVDVGCVGGAHRQWPIVGLHNAAAVVIVSEAEDAPLPTTALSRQLASERAIEDVHVELSPTIYLEHAARRPGRE